MRKQPYLPREIQDSTLERFLLRNKFRVEETKRKINNFFTIKRRYPDFSPVQFENFENTFKIMKYVQFTPLLQLTGKQERIYIWKVIDTNPEIFDYEENIQLSYIIGILYMILFDYSIGEIIIIDWKNFTYKHFLKINPVVFQKIIKIYVEVKSARCIGVHNINIPPFFEAIFSLLKPFLPEKIYKRITVHNTNEDLHEKVPKKYLPLDYGGDGESLEDLNQKWMKEIEVHWEDLKKFNDLLCSEVCEDDGEHFHKELFGVNGTFKRINID